MLLHTDTIDTLEVRKAARLAGVNFTRLELKGSRSRDHKFDLILTGTSGRRQNMGGPDEAARWDEWGIFLGHLFRLDPLMWSPYYADAEHYTWATGGRFTPDFGPGDTHKRHPWEFSGIGVTGSYSVFECGGKNPCGAIMRSLRGQTWAEFQAANA
jgi:hypothetical protein